MATRTWKIIDRGEVPENAASIDYCCVCGHEALLPVLGNVIAANSGGLLVFDIGKYAIPPRVQCRKCGRVLSNETVEQGKG